MPAGLRLEIATLHGVQGSEPHEGVTLAELLAGFSLATDLGLGQPMEHVLRSWRIAARLGQHVDLDDDGQASLYYIAVLAYRQLVGFTVRYQLVAVPVVVAGLSAAAIVVFASLVPAWRASRLNIVEAIGYE